MTQNAAMLWTGGKDSALALYEALQSGWRVCCLVTFAPPEPKFLAHPLAFIQLQAKALELPHYVFSIHDPFAQSYETALGGLRDKMGVHTVIRQMNMRVTPSDSSGNIILLLLILAILGFLAYRYWYLPSKNGDGSLPWVKKN